MSDPPRGVKEFMVRSETLRLRTCDRLEQPFLVGGDRAYLVGTQDGAFPDRGWHLDGEMGGIWAPPGKLLDGFWLEVNGTWLTSASSFTVEPWATSHEYQLDGALAIRRRQYVPDGCAAIVVRYTFSSPTNRTLALRFLARSDLREVWSPGVHLRTRARDIASYVSATRCWTCSNDRSRWCCVVGAVTDAECDPEDGCDLWGPETTRGDGISVSLKFHQTIQAGEEVSVDFVICGSETGVADARRLFDWVSLKGCALFEKKAHRVDTMLSRSTLAVPDASIEGAWDWLKCNYDWLVRDVPGIGRGLGAGAEEFMWWFGCDTSYAVLGCLVLGQHQTAIQTLDLIREISMRENGDSGQVIHECTTSGEVTDPGRAQETPHFTLAILETFRWTGDLSFLERNYEFCKLGLLGCNGDNGSLFPYGYGIIEVEGLNRQCVDTAAYTVAALRALSEMAQILDDHTTADRCRDLSMRALSHFDEAFWQEEEGLYADMVASPADMLSRLPLWLCLPETGPEGPAHVPGRRREMQSLLARAESMPGRDRQRGWLLKHWMGICPLDAGVADTARATRVLERMEGGEFTGPYGMYLRALDRSHAMSLNTGVLASCEMRYGRIDQGLRYIRMLTDTIGLHMPGAISEILPDRGCFVQAWSGYAVAWPIVTYLFGVQPNAAQRRLDLNAQLPVGWPAAKLTNLFVGETSFDLEWDGEQIVVRGGDDEWTVASSTVPVTRAHDR